MNDNTIETGKIINLSERKDVSQKPERNLSAEARRVAMRARSDNAPQISHHEALRQLSEGLLANASILQRNCSDNPYAIQVMGNLVIYSGILVGDFLS